MHLLLIRPDCEYEVFAVVDPFDNCQVTSETLSLFDHHKDLYFKVSGALYELIPMRGPDACTTKPLHEEIQEFCFGAGMPRPGFRILWFQGKEANQVICSKAFLKTPKGSTPTSALPTAKLDRDNYFSGRSHKVTIMEGALS